MGDVDLEEVEDGDLSDIEAEILAELQISRFDI